MKLKEHYADMLEKSKEPYNFEFIELRDETNPFSFFEDLTYLCLPEKKDKRVRREYKKYLDNFGEIVVNDINKNIHLSDKYPTHHSKRDAMEAMIYYIDYLDLNKQYKKAKYYHRWLCNCITEINANKKYLKTLKKELDEKEQKSQEKEQKTQEKE